MSHSHSAGFWSNHWTSVRKKQGLNNPIRRPSHLSCCPICAWPQSRHCVFLNVEGMRPNGGRRQAQEVRSPDLCYFHAVQTAFAAFSQNLLYASLDRASSPAQLSHFRFAGNEKQVQAGSAQLSIQGEAVHSRHSAPRIRISKAFNMGKIPQKETLANHHGSVLDAS